MGLPWEEIAGSYQFSEALRSLGSTADRGEQFAEMEKRIAGLEGQITTAEQLAAEFAQLSSRAQEQAAAQERTGAEIAAAGAEAARIVDSIASLAGKIDGVLQLRDQMDRVEELNAQFAAMNGAFLPPCSTCSLPSSTWQPLHALTLFTSAGTSVLSV